MFVRAICIAQDRDPVKVGPNKSGTRSISVDKTSTLLDKSGTHSYKIGTLLKTWEHVEKVGPC